MKPEARLAIIYEVLVASGMRALVMGGHAVRFYGVERTTIDYDLHLVGADWERLPDILRKAFASRREPLVEGPSWRPRDFRRFTIGRLPDGREERLECWRKNHLLPAFEELYTRRSEGRYGGKILAFLGLKDLIRSKETEREDDWRDLEFLEEILDERVRAEASDSKGTIALLSQLRSRRGFEASVRFGFFEDVNLVAEAWTRPCHPVTRAFLAPYQPRQPEAASLPDTPSMIVEVLCERLPKVEPASSRHIALVEVVRRLYKRAAMEADRQDKLQHGSSDS